MNTQEAQFFQNIVKLFVLFNPFNNGFVRYVPLMWKWWGTEMGGGGGKKGGERDYKYILHATMTCYIFGKLFVLCFYIKW